ncbi:probable JmjC domain-containing histone demethylation protein 2C isoform X1 [Tachysurus ichikawai]
MELVGRRFLCVSAGEERELGGVTRWGWRAGLIRAVTSSHTDSPTLAVSHISKHMFTPKGFTADLYSPDLWDCFRKVERYSIYCLSVSTKVQLV